MHVCIYSGEDTLVFDSELLYSAYRNCSSLSLTTFCFSVCVCVCVLHTGLCGIASLAILSLFLKSFSSAFTDMVHNSAQVNWFFA